MFPSLDPCEADERAIEELVELMRSRTPAPAVRDNTRIPAGFTYLGQFIDHDITFDPVSQLERQIDPRALVNFRTPRFDLDSVYGAGPAAQPFLYDAKKPNPPGPKLLVGTPPANTSPAGVPLASEDLPRNQQGRALIGDPRNDENVIVGQLHLLFIRFHNAVVRHLERKPPEGDLFEAAQRTVRWHYQWIVMHEFLSKIVGEATAERVFASSAGGKAPIINREHFKWRREPFIPVEFSGAAYRFGHSMVRTAYGIKRREGSDPLPAIPLFPDLEGLDWLPKKHVIDWERFFDLGTPRKPQASHPVDTTIVKALFSLPDGGKALAQLNLLRGRTLGLPSGQDVAEAMGEDVLSAGELLLENEQIHPAARKVLVRSTPLWYYILREAAHRAEGKHLGPVGGRIVAEVLVGLLEGDPSSYLSKQPDWRPTELGPEGQKGKGDFTMADLVKFARPSG